MKTFKWYIIVMSRKIQCNITITYSDAKVDWQKDFSNITKKKISLCVLKYFIMFMFVLVPQIYIHHLEKGLNQVRKCAMMEERGGGTDKARVRREGGEWWRLGGVVDCFSYKSGIADGSPYQTTGCSGLCVFVTGAKEGGRAFYNS